MLSATNKILVLALCSSLVGCLGAEDKKTSSSEASSESTPIVMGSVSADKNCSNGKQGTMIYDQEQAQFYFCNNDQWVAVDLRGPKGDKGDTGALGSNGAAGVAGAAGANGTNGRDGMDGDGIRLALKDNGQVKGILVQYFAGGGSPLALITLPNGDIIYIDMITGVFTGSPSRVYYTDEYCMGSAYTGRSDSPGPNVLGRIYVGRNNSGTPVAYYRAVEYSFSVKEFKSSRIFDIVGQMYNCDYSPKSFQSMVRVEEISPIPSLSHLAPIRFSP